MQLGEALSDPSWIRRTVKATDIPAVLIPAQRALKPVIAACIAHLTNSGSQPLQLVSRLAIAGLHSATLQGRCVVHVVAIASVAALVAYCLTTPLEEAPTLSYSPLSWNINHFARSTPPRTKDGWVLFLFFVRPLPLPLRPCSAPSWFLVRGDYRCNPPSVSPHAA